MPCPRLPQKRRQITVQLAKGSAEVDAAGGARRGEGSFGCVNCHCQANAQGTFTCRQHAQISPLSLLFLPFSRPLTPSNINVDVSILCAFLLLLFLPLLLFFCFALVVNFNAKLVYSQQETARSGVICYSGICVTVHIPCYAANSTSPRPPWTERKRHRGCHFDRCQTQNEQQTQSFYLSFIAWHNSVNSSGQTKQRLGGYPVYGQASKREREREFTTSKSFF